MRFAPMSPASSGCKSRDIAHVRRSSARRLKPLFSFAGGGIIFSPTDADIAAIPDDQRHLYILQRRIAFTPVIETPDGPTRAELRIMLVRAGDTYRAVLPLVRMGRGKAMGVDHNKGMAYVGASAALIAQ